MKHSMVNSQVTVFLLEPSEEYTPAKIKLLSNQLDSALNVRYMFAFGEIAQSLSTAGRNGPELLHRGDVVIWPDSLNVTTLEEIEDSFSEDPTSTAALCYDEDDDYYIKANILTKETNVKFNWKHMQPELTPEMVEIINRGSALVVAVPLEVYGELEMTASQVPIDDIVVRVADPMEMQLWLNSGIKNLTVYNTDLKQISVSDANAGCSKETFKSYAPRVETIDELLETEEGILQKYRDHLQENYKNQAALLRGPTEFFSN